ncbi:unnamed protein product [Closterium sp. Naga37s-1]|nr:unnamed protein product [Closterium sp. Naga37s-1]
MRDNSQFVASLRAECRCRGEKGRPCYHADRGGDFQRAPPCAFRRRNPRRKGWRQWAELKALRRKSGQAEQRRGEGGARAEDEGSLSDEEEEEEGHRRRLRLRKERRLGQSWISGISSAGQRAFRRLLLGADGERGKAERVLSASAEAEAQSNRGRRETSGEWIPDETRADARWSSAERAGKLRRKGKGNRRGGSASDIMAIPKGLGEQGAVAGCACGVSLGARAGKIGGSCAEGEEAWRERGNPMVSPVLRILSRCDRPNEADDLFRS